MANTKDKITTVADLPPGTQMGNVKVRVPKGENHDAIDGWWTSQWGKGVWIKKEKTDTQVHPVFVENLEECYKWEVLEVSK